jgi:hypothetical protein
LKVSGVREEEELIKLIQLVENYLQNTDEKCINCLVFEALFELHHTLKLLLYNKLLQSAFPTRCNHAYNEGAKSS